MRDLRTVFAQLGLTLPNLNMTDATAISDDGHTIAGYGKSVFRIPAGDLRTEAWLGVLPAPTIVQGDYNRNGTVDAADYVVWREMLNQMGPNLAADGNSDNRVDAEDYAVWRARFGRTAGSGSGAMLALASHDPVPEPISLWAIIVGGLCLVGLMRRREAFR
jgi:hypothetical protein